MSTLDPSKVEDMMPRKASLQFSPQIIVQRKCPKSDDSFHLEVVASLLYLKTAGLQPVNVSLACGCKMKLRDIPNQRRGAKRVYPRQGVKPTSAVLSDVLKAPRGFSDAEKRRRFDEAQCKLWPTSRRRAGESKRDAPRDTVRR